MMTFTKKEQLVLIFIIVTALIGSGVFFIGRFRPDWIIGEPDFVAGEDNNSMNKPPEEVIVHVTGEVKMPDLYRLEKGMRVADAIQLAGGATEKADIQKINLAARAIDGERIYVPAKLTPPPPIPKTQPYAFKDGHKTQTIDSNPKSKINLNTAIAEELQSLPGIGPVMAKRIIEYRSAHGVFYNTEEIKEVNGIGEKTYEKVKTLITVY